ncbi:hypothetical protein KW798_00415 [Candidatus Parcubacteria bacterium]|nr:hypothetical protein [Candidatus Parcubacteria bacterium]
MNLWNKFWHWYERTYTFNITVALVLFLLQIVHLVWLFGEVIWTKLYGVPLFTFEGVYKILIILVDYTEIPAIISVSLIYIDELRRNWSTQALLFLLMLNSQWLHLFWITDEVVVETFTSHALVAIPLWLAWIAILIDYLEVPVMFDTLRRFFKAIQHRRSMQVLSQELRSE